MKCEKCGNETFIFDFTAFYCEKCGTKIRLRCRQI